MITKEQLQSKIDLKTKPLGALGQLEELALQIGFAQQTLTPQLLNPHLVVFASDHGIAREGVSAYPQEVTYQMVMNFLQGGAAINVFCKQHAIQLLIADAGVNFDFAPYAQLRDTKVAKSTQSFLTAQAMTAEQLTQSLALGRAIVQQIAQTGCNVIGFGEMGIGNTSAASMLMSELCGIPLATCVGKGTGLTTDQVEKKVSILKQAQQFHGPIDNPLQVLQTYGGFEMAQMCGAMLEAYEQNMLVLIDGFIASSVYLVAHTLQPAIASHAIFCHLSDETGHRLLLEHLQAKPLIQLQLRVGEGTGCAIAYPLLQSAVAFMNEMASFESAGVSNKD